MINDKLVNRTLSQYFDTWQVIKKWETTDHHFLAIIKAQNRQYIFKSPYPYALSAYYSRSFYSLNSTAKYLKICYERNLPVIPFTKNKQGEYITKITDKRFTYVIPYFEHHEKQTWDIIVLREVAKTQAKLHNVASEIKFNRLKRHKLTFIDYEMNFRKIEKKSQTQFLKNLLNRGVTELSYIRENFDKLPNGICHNDIGKVNILYNTKSKELKIIDFDFSDRNIFAIDLSMAIKHFCLVNKAVFTANEMQTYLSAYQTVRRLSQSEVRVLKSALVFTSWPIYNFVTNKLNESYLEENIKKIDSLH